MPPLWRKRYFAAGLFGVSLLASGAVAAQAQAQAPQPAPDAEQQEKLLAAMRDYAGQYVSNLPNFICEQVVEQFEAGKKPKHWHKGDTLTSKLIFNQGREERSLELVNDKPLKAGRHWRTPLVTEGEFGILLGNVLGAVSRASFTWNGWQELRGKRLAVFDYAIGREHSTLRLSLSDLAAVIVAYHGSLFADPDNGNIWRITNSASDIPPEVLTKSISTVIDYGEVPIAGVGYLLPVSATVSLQTDSNNVRNEIIFRGYRKFETDSTITYGANPE